MPLPAQHCVSCVAGRMHRRLPATREMCRAAPAIHAVRSLRPTLAMRSAERGRAGNGMAGGDLDVAEADADVEHHHNGASPARRPALDGPSGRRVEPTHTTAWASSTRRWDT